MVIVIDKRTNVFLNHDNKGVKYLSNGYPCLIDKNIAFPTEMVDIYEDVTIPEGVTPNKYCYTPTDGFTVNPNYVEPNKYGLPNELLNTIQADYTEELISEGVI